jgi:hypothetical protein
MQVSGFGGGGLVFTLKNGLVCKRDEKNRYHHKVFWAGFPPTERPYALVNP